MCCCSGCTQSTETVLHSSLSAHHVFVLQQIIKGNHFLPKAHLVDMSYRLYFSNLQSNCQPMSYVPVSH
jgi:hypothetical protein